MRPNIKIALEKIVRLKMGLGVPGNFFISTNHDSAVKITIRSNVQHY